MINNEIVALLTPTVEDMGYVLWGCEYLSQGKHSLLRVYIDKADGIGIEDCEQVSRNISALLDVEDPLPGHYTLEVSSPGIPRPLFYSHHYQLFLGQSVQIKLIKPEEGKRKFCGEIISADDNTLILNIDNEQREFNISQIVKAHLTV